MTRTQTKNTWALHGLVSIYIGLAIYHIIPPDVLDGFGELWTVPISLGVVPLAKTFGLSENLVLTISKPVTPLLTPWGIGLVLAKTTVTILENVVTTFRELIG